MPQHHPISSGSAPYIQVVNAIAARISDGQYTSADGSRSNRLPAERTLAAEFGVAYQTVRHATEVLRSRGLIISRQGRGTFVVPP
jgi:GntR family transcriptional regulator